MALFIDSINPTSLAVCTITTIARNYFTTYCYQKGYIETPYGYIATQIIGSFFAMLITSIALSAIGIEAIAFSTGLEICLTLIATSRRYFFEEKGEYFDTPEEAAKKYPGEVIPFHGRYLAEGQWWESAYDATQALPVKKSDPEGDSFSSPFHAFLKASETERERVFSYGGYYFLSGEVFRDPIEAYKKLSLILGKEVDYKQNRFWRGERFTALSFVQVFLHTFRFLALCKLSDDLKEIDSLEEAKRFLQEKHVLGSTVTHCSSKEELMSTFKDLFNPRYLPPLIANSTFGDNLRKAFSAD